MMSPDRIHYRYPIWCQRPRNRGKITVKMAHADMFKHVHWNKFGRNCRADAGNHIDEWPDVLAVDPVSPLAWHRRAGFPIR